MTEALVTTLSDNVAKTSELITRIQYIKLDQCPSKEATTSIKQKPFYSINEVADLFEVNRRTVHRRIKAGDIKTIKFGALVRIPAKSLKKYLAQI